MDYVFVDGEPSKDGLPQQSCRGVPAILSCPRIGQNLSRPVPQSERVVEFAVGKQAGVGGRDRAAKLQPRSGRTRTGQRRQGAGVQGGFWEPPSFSGRYND